MWDVDIGHDRHKRESFQAWSFHLNWGPLSGYAEICNTCFPGKT
eukprot:gene25012-32590_t